MQVMVLPEPDAVATAMADRIENRVQRGPTVLGLATGSSPLRGYQALIERSRATGLSFAACSAYLLDEYVGLGADHRQSYAQVIRRDLVAQIDLPDRRVHAPDGCADDLDAEAARYDRAIADSGGIDLQVLGIGANGHIGFNEPPADLAARTHVQQLSAQTRRDNARFFAAAEDVPRSSITQGLATIMAARDIILVATGDSKLEPLSAAIKGPISPQCPASVLQRHPSATVITDCRL